MSLSSTLKHKNAGSWGLTDKSCRQLLLRAGATHCAQHRAQPAEPRCLPRPSASLLSPASALDSADVEHCTAAAADPMSRLTSRWGTLCNSQRAGV